METHFQGMLGATLLSATSLGSNAKGHLLVKQVRIRNFNARLVVRIQKLNMKTRSYCSSFNYSAFVMARGIATTTPLTWSLNCVTSLQLATPTKTALPVSQGMSSAGKL